MDFAFELIYVQEIFVYLRFSWSGEQVFFCRLNDFYNWKNLLFFVTRLNNSASSGEFFYDELAVGDT